MSACNLTALPTVIAEFNLSSAQEDGATRDKLIALGWAPPESAAVMAPSDDDIDAHLDAVLRASGSALKHFSMASTKSAMREAMRAAMRGYPPTRKKA